MSKWQVELTGHQFDLEDLPRWFTAPELRVVEQDTENLNSAEWCDASKLLVLTFSSGVSVEMMPSEIGDPSSEFAAQEASYPGVVTAGSIRAEPAAFAEPGATDPTSVQRAPGGVEFVEGMLLIDVVGNDSIALDDLKAVTESLAPYAPR